MTSSAELISLTDADFGFGAVPVLKGLCFSVRESEIHAVVGEHGAGKTSLALLLNGDRTPSRGVLHASGQRMDGYGRRKAEGLGVRMVYQGVELNGAFTVAENLFFGNRSVVASPFRSYARRNLEERARAYFSRLGFAIDPSLPARELTPSDQALVSVLRQLYTQPRLLILDEALERLSTANAERVTALLKGLTAAGSAIVFITHHIDDIYELADRVSILREGELLLTEDVKNIDKVNLLKIAYTHISRESYMKIGRDEFSQYLKYNEAILKELPIILIVTDREQRLKFVNDSARRFFSLEESAFFDLPVEAILHGENDRFVPMLRIRAPEGQMRAFYNVPLSLPHRTSVTNVIVYPIYDAGVLIGTIAIIEDVTEREMMRERMVLSEKLASVGLLAAGVAHEINNPLGTIYNYLESLKYLGRGNEDHARLVADLEEQVEYIASIVENLLTFSDTRRIPPEKIECNALIQSIIRLVQHSARSKGIGIEFSASVPLIELTVNGNELKQVVLNLFKNSFEAMPNGGTIRIFTQRLLRDGGHWFQLRFQDDGTGIQYENPSDVFLPFSSTKRNGTNLGLGLSISFSLIRKYDGDISVRNLSQGGCEFTIVIPMRE